MTRRPGCPNPDDVLASLKQFQRATVEYAFQRFYLDQPVQRRFLVADGAGQDPGRAWGDREGCCPPVGLGGAD
jgi:hypothetical protein